MRMAIVVPIMGSLHQTKPYWGALMSSVRGPVDLVVIDNAPDNESRVFFNSYVFPHWPGECTRIEHESNIGVVLAMQEAYRETDHDILAYLHNDIYIYERGWDDQVRGFFRDNDKVGLVGFFGSKGLFSDGIRYCVVSNMLEAEIHGLRGEPSTFVEGAILDGMSMICSREMLDVRDGVDESFEVHHFYDLDLSLESLDRGYRTFIYTVPVHHHSGQTANQPLFNDWAKEYVLENFDDKLPNAEAGTAQMIIYEKNRQRFVQKWRDKLPYMLGHGFRAGANPPCP